MRREQILLILLFFCSLVFAREPVTQTQVRMTYRENPRLALQMVDTLEAQHGEPDYVCDLLRAHIYTRSQLMEHDSAIALCLPLLQHDSLIQNTRASADHRADVLSILCAALRAKSDDEQWLRYSIELAELNHRWGDEVEALRMEAEIGFILNRLGQTEEGLAKIDNAIDQLDVIGSMDKLDACIVVMKRKINVLNELDRNEEIIPVAHHILSKLDHFEKHTADYKDDSSRLPNKENVWASYAAFARAQTYAFLANAFAATRSLQQARSYLELFEQTEYSHTFGGRKMILPTWIALGENTKAQAAYDEMEQRLNGDTVCAEYAEILYGRMLIANALNHVEEERSYWQRYTNLTQVLNKKLHESQAHDMAARYHTREQEQNLKKSLDANFRKDIIIGVLVFILVVLLGVMLYFIREHKKAKSKPEANSSSSELTHSPSPDNHTEKTTEYKKLNDRELFEVLTTDIREKKLFLAPDFDRQAITHMYNLRNAQVGAAFSQSGQYASVSDFVRNCRLEHARTLLATTDLPIGEVATKSGYSRQTTFNHDFKMRYGLTPTDFRNKK